MRLISSSVPGATIITWEMAMYEKIRIIVIQNQLLWSPDKSKHDILLLLS